MRNGLQRFLSISHTLCVLFGRWRGSIVMAIDSSSASVEQKAQLHALVNTIDASCAAVDALRIRFET